MSSSGHNIVIVVHLGFQPPGGLPMGNPHVASHVQQNTGAELSPGMAKDALVDLACGQEDVKVCTRRPRSWF